MKQVYTARGIPETVRGFQSRFPNEDLARVFHQGPGNQLNMPVCRTAVRHLLTSLWQSDAVRQQQKAAFELVLNGEALVVRKNPFL